MGRYLDPFTAPTTEFALRQFRSSANKEGHMFCAYPESYTLFHIGTFDPETGLVESFPAPHSLGVAIQFVQSEPQAPIHLTNGEDPIA